MTKQFKGNKEIAKFLGLSTKSWENKNAGKKTEYLEALGAEYEITTEPGKATIYTIHNEEEVEAVLTLKNVFNFRIDSMENLQDFIYCLRVWWSGQPMTNVQLAEGTDVSSQVIGAWKRKLKELEIIADSSEVKYVKYAAGEREEGTQEEWKAMWNSFYNNDKDLTAWRSEKGFTMYQIKGTQGNAFFYDVLGKLKLI